MVTYYFWLNSLFDYQRPFMLILTCLRLILFYIIYVKTCCVMMYEFKNYWNMMISKHLKMIYIARDISTMLVKNLLLKFKTHIWMTHVPHRLYFFLLRIRASCHLLVIHHRLLPLSCEIQNPWDLLDWAFVTAMSTITLHFGLDFATLKTHWCSTRHIEEEATPIQ